MTKFSYRAALAATIAACAFAGCKHATVSQAPSPQEVGLTSDADFNLMTRSSGDSSRIDLPRAVRAPASDADDESSVVGYVSKLSSQGKVDSQVLRGNLKVYRDTVVNVQASLDKKDAPSRSRAYNALAGIRKLRGYLANQGGKIPRSLRSFCQSRLTEAENLLEPIAHPRYAGKSAIRRDWQNSAFQKQQATESLAQVSASVSTVRKAIEAAQATQF